MKALRELKPMEKIEKVDQNSPRGTGVDILALLKANKGKFIDDTELEKATGKTHQYINQSVRHLAMNNVHVVRARLTDAKGKLPQGRWYTAYSDGKSLDDMLKEPKFLMAE
jgi:hypothetical protein